MNTITSTTLSASYCILENAITTLKSETEPRNGVKPPFEGTETKVVWDELNAFRSLDAEPTLQTAFKIAKVLGLAANQTAVTFLMWRQYHAKPCV